MKGLSVCNTSLSSLSDKAESIECFNPKDAFNLEEELKKYSDLKQKQREEITLAYGLRVVVDKALPADSALFMNQENKVVAVYTKGKLVCLPQKEVVNPSDRLPTPFKKKRHGCE